MSSQSQLWQRKSQRTFHLVGLGGVARSLTTAIYKMLATQAYLLHNQEKFMFDGGLNEEFSWGENRIQRGYDMILSIIQNHEAEASESGRNLEQIPIHIIAKNNSHHFSQQGWASFLNLADIQFLSIRNPALSFPSLVNIIIEHILEDNVWAEYAAELEWARKAKDYSHLKVDWFNRNITPEMLKLFQTRRHQRNLANPELDSKFFKLNLTYHRCIDRELKREIWQEVKQGLSAAEANRYAKDYGNWQSMVEDCSQLEWKDLYELPEILRQPIEFYRTGWQGLKKVIKAGEVTQSPIFLYDATDVQLFSKEFLNSALEAMHKVGIIPQEHRKPVPFLESGGKTTVSFSKAIQLNYLHPPLQQPVALENMPLFLHRAIAEAFEIYMELLRLQKMWFPKDYEPSQLANITLSNNKTLLETDPVYVYSRAALWQKENADRTLTQLIRQQWPEFTSYYNIIDRVVGRHK